MPTIAILVPTPSDAGGRDRPPPQKRNPNKNNLSEREILFVNNLSACM